MFNANSSLSLVGVQSLHDGRETDEKVDKRFDLRSIGVDIEAVPYGDALGVGELLDLGSRFTRYSGITSSFDKVCASCNTNWKIVAKFL